MPVYALGSIEPVIHSEAFVHPEAVIIGDVRIGARSSIWPCAVLRGDEAAPIVIGERTSVQDGAVLHTTDDDGTTVGNDCVIGHLAHLEGCTIEDECLIGVGAVVLHRVLVRTGSIVGANATLLDDLDVPAGALVVGSPAVIKPDRGRIELVRDGSANYLRRVDRYPRELRRIG